jgi:hypothetical protein
MASSSSSASSTISFESKSTREPTPEYDPIAAYKVRAPLHWDVEEWDFQTWSEDDESLTDGEDLHLLLGGELEEDDEDDASWEEDFFFSSEEEADSSSTEEDSVAGRFLLGGSSEDDDDKETENNSGVSSNSGRDDGGDVDGSGGDSDVGTAPPIKCRKTSGAYWW